MFKFTFEVLFQALSSTPIRSTICADDQEAAERSINDATLDGQLIQVIKLDTVELVS